MILATDVKYDEEADTALAAAVAFSGWRDAHPITHYLAEVEGIAAYIPGQFYRRELPCLEAVLARVQVSISVVIVDGHVRLGDRPGLGHYLWEALGQRVVVVGVAKSRFHAGGTLPVLRGGSARPLYVSAAGMDDEDAAECVRGMHGSHRLPTMLKLVDQLTRQR